MARKARLTVFSRFLMMMLIVGPLAFLGASYYNGEDGIETIKKMVNGGKDNITQTRTNRTDTEESATVTYEIRKLKEELEFKDKQLDKLYKENEVLKQKLEKYTKTAAGG